ANMFNGLIDELKIHNQVINEEEIQKNYQTVIQTFKDGKLPTPDMKMDRSRYNGDRPKVGTRGFV
ncbi:LamG domain-containing protein, partial [Aeromonas veronii]|nr:LamG domain-containing protein [Aeromonas veronii]